MKQLLFLTVLLSPFAVNAANVTDALVQDNDYKLFNFVVDSTSNAVVRTLSYSGGANAEVKIDLPGGFDQELVIFDNEGTWLDIKKDEMDNDKEEFESYKAQKNLTPGKYAATLPQNKHHLYQDLFPMPSLAAVTWRTSDKDFYGRYSALALNTNASPVPVPSAALLFGSGLLGLSGFKRRSASIS
jgi:hypothetical protein